MPSQEKSLLSIVPANEWAKPNPGYVLTTGHPLAIALDGKSQAVRSKIRLYRGTGYEALAQASFSQKSRPQNIGKKFT